MHITLCTYQKIPHLALICGWAIEYLPALLAPWSHHPPVLLLEGMVLQIGAMYFNGSKGVNSSPFTCSRLSSLMFVCIFETNDPVITRCYCACNTITNIGTRASMTHWNHWLPGMHNSWWYAICPYILCYKMWFNATNWYTACCKSHQGQGVLPVNWGW